jgi:hypothetical protein
MTIRTSRILILAVGLSLAASPAALAQEESPATTAVAVVPAGGDPLGTPYEQWAADWWAWFVGTPAEGHPSSGGDCAAGDQGEVLFIAHVPPDVTMATQCTATTDQWILASGGGTMCDAPDYGATPEERLACVQSDKEVFSNVSVTVDGVAVPDIESYWVESADFDVTYPEGNLYELPAGTTQATVGGWFVMIEPLPAGTHTVVVRDEIEIPDDDQGPLPAELTATIEVSDAAGAAAASQAPAASAAG